MSKFRYAISTADSAPKTAPILLRGSICDNLITASRLGYDAIEIHLRENASIDYDRIKKIRQQYGVGISAVVTGRLMTQEHVSLTDLSKNNLIKAKEGMKKYIDIASAFKTDIIIGWIRGSMPATMNRDEYERMLADSLKLLAASAAEKGVKIHIEAINRYEINTLVSAGEILSFIETHELDNVYVHLDTFHMNIEEVKIAEAIMACGNRLGYVHFADSNRRYPGTGHIEFDKVMNALCKINYKGYISVECLPLPDGETAARKALENIQLLMKDLR